MRLNLEDGTSALQVVAERDGYRGPCGHTRHVGWCGSCQRAQLNRWQLQLEQACELAVAGVSCATAAVVLWPIADVSRRRDRTLSEVHR